MCGHCATPGHGRITCRVRVGGFQHPLGQKAPCDHCRINNVGNQQSARPAASPFDLHTIYHGVDVPANGNGSLSLDDTTVPGIADFTRQYNLVTFSEISVSAEHAGGTGRNVRIAVGTTGEADFTGPANAISRGARPFFSPPAATEEPVVANFVGGDNVRLMSRHVGLVARGRAPGPKVFWVSNSGDACTIIMTIVLRCVGRFAVPLPAVVDVVPAWDVSTGDVHVSTNVRGLRRVQITATGALGRTAAGGNTVDNAGTQLGFVQNVAPGSALRPMLFRGNRVNVAAFPALNAASGRGVLGVAYDILFME